MEKHQSEDVLSIYRNYLALKPKDGTIRYRLHQMYRYGIGCVKNKDRALEIYQRISNKPFYYYQLLLECKKEPDQIFEHLMKRDLDSHEMLYTFVLQQFKTSFPNYNIAEKLDKRKYPIDHILMLSKTEAINELQEMLVSYRHRDRNLFNLVNLFILSDEIQLDEKNVSLPEVSLRTSWEELKGTDNIEVIRRIILNFKKKQLTEPQIYKEFVKLLTKNEFNSDESNFIAPFCIYGPLDDPEIRMALAACYATVDYTRPMAVDLIQEAIQADPQPLFLKVKRQILTKLDRDQFQLAARRHPDDTMILLELAEMWKKDDRAYAKKLYRKVLFSEQDNIEVQKMLQELIYYGDVAPELVEKLQMIRKTKSKEMLQTFRTKVYHSNKEQGKEAYRLYLKENPEDAEVLYLHAEIGGPAEDFIAAGDAGFHPLQSYREALKRLPATKELLTKAKNACGTLDISLKREFEQEIRELETKEG